MKLQHLTSISNSRRLHNQGPVQIHGLVAPLRFPTFSERKLYGALFSPQLHHPSDM